MENGKTSSTKLKCVNTPIIQIKNIADFFMQDEDTTKRLVYLLGLTGSLLPTLCSINEANLSRSLPSLYWSQSEASQSCRRGR